MTYSMLHRIQLPRSVMRRHRNTTSQAPWNLFRHFLRLLSLFLSFLRLLVSVIDRVAKHTARGGVNSGLIPRREGVRHLWWAELQEAVLLLRETGVGVSGGVVSFKAEFPGWVDIELAGVV